MTRAKACLLLATAAVVLLALTGAEPQAQPKDEPIGVTVPAKEAPPAPEVRDSERALPAAPKQAPPEPPPAKSAAEPTKSSPRPGEIVVASWPGAYGRAQDAAVFSPFTAKTGIRIRLEAHDGSGRELERLKAGGLKADVIDMSAGALDAACEAGLIERVESPIATGPDDFLNGARRPCGIASLAWSSVLVVNKERFKGPAPATLAEAFDVRRFPGPRALPKSPRYLMEVALMAAGVPAGEVYAQLSTNEGVARALAKLKSIAPHIVWWSKASEAIQILRERKAVVGLAFSGRAFQEFAFNPAFVTLWDGQIYEFNYWAVAKGTAHATVAREFISFATEPERLATTARHFPYGPARRSAIDLVGRHVALGIDLAAHLPTAPANLASALRFDAAWWAANEARMAKAFEAWHAEATAPPPPPPAPQAPPRNRPPR